MLKLINILSILPALWRFARDMAKVMEETIPDDGYGNDKLKAIDGALRTAIRVSDDTDDKMEEKLSTLTEGVAQGAVSLMRTTGELQAIAQKAKADIQAVVDETDGVISVAIDEANAAIENQ